MLIAVQLLMTGTALDRASEWSVWLSQFVGPGASREVCFRMWTESPVPKILSLDICYFESSRYSVFQNSWST